MKQDPVEDSLIFESAHSSLHETKEDQHHEAIHHEAQSCSRHRVRNRLARHTGGRIRIGGRDNFGVAFGDDCCTTDHRQGTALQLCASWWIASWC